MKETKNSALYIYEQEEVIEASPSLCAKSSSPRVSTDREPMYAYQSTHTLKLTAPLILLHLGWTAAIRLANPLDVPSAWAPDEMDQAIS